MSAQRLLEWLAYSWAVIITGLALFVISSFLRIYSTHFISAVEAKRFLRSSTVNKGSGVAIVCYILGLVTMFVSAFGDVNLWAFALICMAHAFFGWVRRVQPPLVLFLSASSPDADTVFRILRATVARKGAPMNLLHPESTSRITKLDTFRTLDPDMWRFVVAEIADVVPVIVLDLRTATGPLRDEFEIIISQRLQYKTLILTNMPTAPDIRRLLHSLSLGPPDLATAAVINVSDLHSAIRLLVASSKSLPTPNRPIAQTLRRFRVAI